MAYRIPLVLLVAALAAAAGYFAHEPARETAERAPSRVEVTLSVSDPIPAAVPAAPPEPEAVAAPVPPPPPKAKGKAGSPARRGESRYAQFRQRHRGTDRAEVAFDRALDAAEAGDRALARRHLARVLRLNARHAMAHLLSGVLSQEEGDGAGARREYQAYLDAAPRGAFAAEVTRVLASGAADPALEVAAR